MFRPTPKTKKGLACVTLTGNGKQGPRNRDNNNLFCGARLNSVINYKRVNLCISADSDFVRYTVDHHDIHTGG